LKFSFKGIICQNTPVLKRFKWAKNSIGPTTLILRLKKVRLDSGILVNALNLEDARVYFFLSSEIVWKINE
jgi:hypothetical protein